MESPVEDPDLMSDKKFNKRYHGEDPDLTSDKQSKKRYHRHTARQIQELEAMFKQCPHPDENQRLRLSRDLGLEPRQVKFWFQNRRTQLKAQHERADNSALRAENDKIRCENLAICEALKNVVCPNCGGPPAGELSFEEQQRLRLENARLKEELDRLSSIAAKYIGRPLTTTGLQGGASLPAIGGLFGHDQIGPGPCASSSSAILPPLSAASATSARCIVTDLDKPLITELALNAVEELVRLAQTDEPLWFHEGGTDILNTDAYAKIFPKSMKSMLAHSREEASRSSSHVMINAASLVDIFMDVEKWGEIFPTIVCRARNMDVIVPAIAGNRHGSLQWMFAEVQVLTPLVQTREMQFLRYAHHYTEGLWAVADVWWDKLNRDEQAFPSSSSSASTSSAAFSVRCRRLPSGVVIQDMPNGYSKVTWVEHVEVEDRGVHRIYRHLVSSGAAFGAQRWLSTLQRMCERLASLMMTPPIARNDASVTAREICSRDGRRSITDLSHNMIANFCANVSASAAAASSCCSSSSSSVSVSVCEEEGVRITTRRTTNVVEPAGLVLCAATSFWMPISPLRLFDFLRDERTRPEWDVHPRGSMVQEVAHIATGSHPRNRISLLRVCNWSNDSMVILQECCCDFSGCMIVYSPVDVSTVKAAMIGEDVSHTAVMLPSGFVILPDGNADSEDGDEHDGDDYQSARRRGGSLVTVELQIPVSEVTQPKLNVESVAIVNDIMCKTVQRIKAALQCSHSS